MDTELFVYSLVCVPHFVPHFQNYVPHVPHFDAHFRDFRISSLIWILVFLIVNFVGYHISISDDCNDDDGYDDDDDNDNDYGGDNS